MSESKRKSIYYNREDLTGLGESKVQVMEVANSGETSSININGKTIWFKPLSVVAPSGHVKSYLVIEKFGSIPLTTVDLVYGNIDIDALSNNEELREEYFEKVITRENMELITRKYAGTLPILVEDYHKNQKLTIPQDVAIAVAQAVYGEAHLEARTTVTKINNDIFGKAKQEEKGEPILKSVFQAATGKPPVQKKKTSFFDKLFNAYTEEEAKEKEPTREITPYTEPTTSYTSTQGVLFYRSGSVVLDDRICSKYNYCTKDVETGIKNEVDSFLITGVDENRLQIDADYRKKFVDQVLVPSRLKNARNIPIFPYIGGFTDEGKFENDVELTMAFRELTLGAR